MVSSSFFNQTFHIAYHISTALWGVVLCVPLTVIVLRHINKQRALAIEKERIWSKELYPEGKASIPGNGVHVHFHDQQKREWTPADIEMQKEDGSYRRYPKEVEVL
jgi:hypothetical protein